MSSEFFRANVGALIVDNEGRLLALRRADVADDAWQLPHDHLSVALWLLCT